MCMYVCMHVCMHVCIWQYRTCTYSKNVSIKINIYIHVFILCTSIFIYVQYVRIESVIQR